MVREGLFLVRIYGEKHNDHWALVSLDFGLAAQGKTVEEAFHGLMSRLKNIFMTLLWEKIKSLKKSFCLVKLL